LHQNKCFCSSSRNMYFFDVTTLVNERHTTLNLWVDSIVKSKKHALVSGLPSGIRQHTRKGGLLLFIVVVNQML
jgi:hypothetical protein